MPHRAHVRRVVDDLDGGEDRRVESLEQPAAERHALRAGHAEQGVDLAEVFVDGFLDQHRLALAQRPLGPLDVRAGGRRDDQGVDAPERVEVGEPARTPAFGQRLTRLGVGVDHARELGLHRLRDDAGVQRSHSAGADERDAERRDPHRRPARRLSTERDAHGVDDPVEVGVGEVRVHRQREHLPRRVTRVRDVGRNDQWMGAVAVVVENDTRVRYAALHASDRRARRPTRPGRVPLRR